MPSRYTYATHPTHLTHPTCLTHPTPAHHTRQAFCLTIGALALHENAF